MNLINKGGALLAGNDIDWFHLVLNYLMPYSVASYSAAKTKRRGEKMNEGLEVNKRESKPENTSLLSDTDFLDTLRRQMLQFATMQLSDSDLAEDAVQEALIGALKNAKSFGGRAALKTWVFAILKNKIADALRQKQRVVNASSLTREDNEDEDFSALFNAKGFWQADERPVGWSSPEEAMREGQFWRVFEVCLENLPGHQARVFMMREFVELDSHEICASVGITVSNLNVMLHRARLRLRECLENRWFIKGEQSC